MKSENRYDVVVVGAGPAGAMTALYASQGGCRVALLERKEKVGIPVRCGEAVGFKGFTVSCEIEDRWVLSKVSKIRMISPSGYTVDLANRSKIGKNYVLDRTVMDDELVQRAVAAGAVYFPSTAVISVAFNGKDQYTCTTPEQIFYSSSVVCADGVESKVARDLGWNTSLSLNDIESCAFCHVEHDLIEQDTIEFHVGSKKAPGGFVWIFPRGGHCANVGLGVLGSKSNGGKALEYLQSFIKGHFPGAKISQLNCGGVPVGKWLKPLVRDGALVVGDAARQVSSLSGGGITYSLFAGRAAGETLAEARRDGRMQYPHLKQYQKKWAAYCGRQQHRSYVLKSMLLKKDNDNFYDSIAQALMKEDPQSLNYTRVFRRVFSRHPVVLLKTFLLFR